MPNTTTTEVTLERLNYVRCILERYTEVRDLCVQLASDRGVEFTGRDRLLNFNLSEEKIGGASFEARTQALFLANQIGHTMEQFAGLFGIDLNVPPVALPIPTEKEKTNG